MDEELDAVFSSCINNLVSSGRDRANEIMHISRRNLEKVKINLSGPRRNPIDAFSETLFFFFYIFGCFCTGILQKIMFPGSGITVSGSCRARARIGLKKLEPLGYWIESNH